jgi:hypothetical protein
MNGLSRRVRELETNELKPVELGSTKLNIDDLPEAEKALFIHAQTLVLYKQENALTLEQRDILSKAGDYFFQRASDLFLSAMQIEVGDNALVRYGLMGRLMWFVHEMKRYALQCSTEDKIHERLSAKYPSNNEEEDLVYAADYDREYDVAWKEFEDSKEDKTALWSQESFEHFYDMFLKGSVEKHLGSIGEPE